MDFVFGFTAKYLIPHVMINTIVNILGRFMTYKEKLEDTLIQNISEMSPVFEHSGLVILQLEKANCGVTSQQLQLATKFRPWGLTPPPCGRCHSVLNIVTKKMKKNRVKIRCTNCRVNAQLSKEGLKGRNVGSSTKLWFYPWPYVNNVWKDVEWRVAGEMDEEMDISD